MSLCDRGRVSVKSHAAALINLKALHMLVHRLTKAVVGTSIVLVFVQYDAING